MSNWHTWKSRCNVCSQRKPMAEQHQAVLLMSASRPGARRVLLLPLNTSTPHSLWSQIIRDGMPVERWIITQTQHGEKSDDKHGFTFHFLKLSSRKGSHVSCRPALDHRQANQRAALFDGDPPSTAAQPTTGLHIWRTVRGHARPQNKYKKASR